MSYELLHRILLAETERDGNGDWSIVPHFPKDEIAKLNTLLPATESSMSYFFQFYRYLCNVYGTSLYKLQDEEQHITSITFLEYDHPIWTNWNDIWAKPPLSLDPELIDNPTIEFAFHSTLFRLRLDSFYFTGINKDFRIRQGTTIEFKGYKNPDIRFIVEWCHWIDRHNAYLKVVGIDLEGHFFPPTDPDFPTFMLIVPECLVDVPSPSSAITFQPSIPLNDDEIDSNNFKFCWACSNGFY